MKKIHDYKALLLPYISLNEVIPLIGHIFYQ